MKKKFLLWVLGCLPACWMGAQQLSPTVIASACENSRASFIQLEWTLGENAVLGGTVAGSAYTEGFHQPLLVLHRPGRISQSVIPAPDISLSVMLAPNPVQSVLGVQVRSEKNQTLEISLTDMLGNGIWKQKINPPASAVFNLSGRSAGIYLLLIRDEKGTVLYQNKIAKTN